ncbi:MAG: adenosylhomocysteinase [Acidobacteria bacterium]|nr:adenosylhomocysteinase [Acidobacteriota bacterium]
MSKASNIACDVKDLGLADTGKLRLEWADQFMPVLTTIRKQFEKKQPLKGIRVSACLHVTTETGNLMITLKAGGADVVICASNPLSTQDDVAACLVRDHGIPVYAVKGEDNDSYYSHLNSAIEHRPNLTMDDGADLVTLAHTKRTDMAKDIFAGTEETTTGVIRLRSMSRQGILKYPIVAVNDANTKHFFDNRYGTGQSTLDGILRATNVLIAGLAVVVCGYGWCGKGLALRSRGLGANVIVTEVDPTRALEAAMEGYRVMSLAEAAPIGNLFITVTGNKNVLRKEHFEKMQDGTLLANSGHFNAEIDIPALEKLSTGKRTTRSFVEEYTQRDGRKLNLLGEGRLINLVSAEGHPASVMDMSFANQALAAEYLVENASKLENKVYPVPEAIDQDIAAKKLDAMGIHIDKLTAEQEKYMVSWSEGT